MVHDILHHFVWLTKCRCKVLSGHIAHRLRELLAQGCEARGITLIEGAVGKEHVHMLVSSPTNLAPSIIAKYLRGRPSRLMQDESPN
jgi:putative transposase